MGIRDLPAVNATLNGTAAVLLVVGRVLIAQRKVDLHKKTMLTAFGVSVAFLICYLVYHAQVGSVPFQKTGAVAVCLFQHFDHSHDTGGMRTGAGYHYAAPGTEGQIRGAPSYCPVDVSDLVVRQCHGRGCLPDALSTMRQANCWDPGLYDSTHRYVFDYGKSLVELLAPRPGESILDAGCGTGHLTHQIAEAGADVLGIDQSPEMVAQARQNYPKLAFQLADVTQYRGESGSMRCFPMRRCIGYTMRRPRSRRFGRRSSPAGGSLRSSGVGAISTRWLRRRAAIRGTFRALANMPVCWRSMGST